MSKHIGMTGIPSESIAINMYQTINIKQAHDSRGELMRAQLSQSEETVSKIRTISPSTLLSSNQSFKNVNSCAYPLILAHRRSHPSGYTLPAVDVTTATLLWQKVCYEAQELSCRSSLIAKLSLFYVIGKTNSRRKSSGA